jgi:hypothetical protein
MEPSFLVIGVRAEACSWLGPLALVVEIFVDQLSP